MDGSFAYGPKGRARRGHRGAIRRHAKALAVGTALAVLTAGAVGIALWSVSGGGDEYAKSSSSQALATVNISASITGDLFPGGDGDLEIRISNPNVFAVTVTEINVSGAVTPTGCFVTADSQTGLSIAVSAGGTADHTGVNKAHMGAGAGDACQNTVFTVPVSLVGTQS